MTSGHGIIVLLCFLLTFGCTGVFAPEGKDRSKSSENQIGKSKKRPSSDRDGDDDKDDDKDSDSKKKKKKKKDDDDDEDLDALPYDAKIGDTWERETRTRSWAAGEDEPDEWDSETTESLEVVRLFNETCDYQYERTVGETSTVIPFGCQSDFSCTPDVDPPDCDEEDLDDADVGDFTDAKGKRIICKTVFDINGDQRVTKSTTDTWSHPDKLKIDGSAVVKTESYSCTITITDGTDPDDVDPCDTDEFDITYGRTITEIPTQTEGEGEDKIDYPTASVTLGGDLDLPEDRSDFAATCTLTEDFVNGGNVLSVSIGQSLCQNEDDLGSAAVSFTNLTPEAGTDIAVTTTALSAGYRSNPTGFQSFISDACTITMEADSDTGIISGTADCPSPFTLPAGGADEATAEEIEFACFAPSDLDLSGF